MPDLLNLNQLMDWLEAEQTGKRKSYSHYLSEPLYTEFKKLCRTKNPSRVLEYLIQCFIAAAKERERESHKPKKKS